MKLCPLPNGRVQWCRWSYRISNIPWVHQTVCQVWVKVTVIFQPKTQTVPKRGWTRSIRHATSSAAWGTSKLQCDPGNCASLTACTTSKAWRRLESKIYLATENRDISRFHEFLDTNINQRDVGCFDAYTIATKCADHVGGGRLLFRPRKEWKVNRFCGPSIMIGFMASTGWCLLCLWMLLQIYPSSLDYANVLTFHPPPKNSKTSLIQTYPNRTDQCNLGIQTGTTNPHSS